MKIGDGSIDTAITVLGAFKCAINKTGQINVREENEKEINGYIDMAIDALKKQPKIGGWIPCSERLPEEDGFYLVTLTEKITDINDIRVTKVFFSEKSNSFTGYGKTVIAWQPLPEAYCG